MEYLFVYIPGCCTVHHFASIVQPRAHTETGQVINICSCGVVEYRASENVTQVCLAIYSFQDIGSRTDLKLVFLTR